MTCLRFCVLILALVLFGGPWAPVSAQSLTLAEVDEAPPPVPGFISLAGANTSGFAQPLTYPVGTKLSLAWDPYTAEELANSGANRWEVEVTGPTPGSASLGIGSTTFPIPALAIGSHTISVRGCNPTACSAPASIAFVMDPIVPPMPRNPRLVPTPEPISLAQAATMAHGYKAVMDPWRPTLSASELVWLQMRYAQQAGPPPLTWLSVRTFLDGVAHELTSR